jgi:hypothetical protein
MHGEYIEQRNGGYYTTWPRRASRWTRLCTLSMRAIYPRLLTKISRRGRAHRSTAQSPSTWIARQRSTSTWSALSASSRKHHLIAAGESGTLGEAGACPRKDWRTSRLSLRLQADADLKYPIVRAVRRREPGIDFAPGCRIRPGKCEDPELLERAAQEGRILVSHDRRTMLAHFRARPEARKPSAGLFVVSQGAAIGLVVNAIVLAWPASEPSEWRDQVHHLPSLTRHVFTS